MKFLHYSLFLVFLLLIFLVCNRLTDNHVTNQPAFYIEKLYATSTLDTNSVYQLFDNDTSTYWATRQNAGINEEIYIEFSDSITIGYIKLTALLKKRFAKISKIALLVNNSTYMDCNIKNIITIKKAVKSLSIRIIDIEKMHFIENTEEENYKLMVPKTNAVGVSEICFMSTENDTLQIYTPKKIEGTVTALSVLEPKFTYSPELLFDSRIENAWLEGDRGSGKGEFLKFRFDKKILISAIKINNGYQRTDELYRGNARIKSIRFGNSKTKYKYSLNDSKIQVIPVEPTVSSRDFFIEITDVYKGEQFDNLAISELRFYSGEQPVIINSSKSIDSTYCSTFPRLQRILNTRFRNYFTTDSGYVEHSFIINSDASFYFYRQYLPNANKKEMHIENFKGFWKIVTNEQNKIRLSVVGTKQNLQTENDSVISVKNESFSEYFILREYWLQPRHSLKKLYFDISPSSFVDITKLSDDFVLDMKYATKDNFTGEQLYDCPKCLLRYIVAKALIEVNKEFIKKGFRIKFFDCYRPLSVQKRMWEIYPNRVYIADPNVRASIHNRGGAVDITLIDKNGEELNMGTPFDFFGRKAFPDFTDLPQNVLDNRKLLRSVMEKAGFRISRSEWWHYSHKSTYHFPPSDFSIPCD